MKILIVGPAWPYRGGIADFDERIAREYIKKGDEVEIISPGKCFDTMQVNELYNENGELIDNANKAMMKLSIPCDKIYPKGAIIRMKK